MVVCIFFSRTCHKIFFSISNSFSINHRKTQFHFYSCRNITCGKSNVIHVLSYVMSDSNILFLTAVRVCIFFAIVFVFIFIQTNLLIFDLYSLTQFGFIPFDRLQYYHNIISSSQICIDLYHKYVDIKIPLNVIPLCSQTII